MTSYLHHYEDASWNFIVDMSCVVFYLVFIVCLITNFYIEMMQVGYIVMREPSTGARTKLLRMKGAEVVGVYHPLIDEKLMRVLHRFDSILKHLAASS